MRRAQLLLNGLRVADTLVAETFWSRFRGMLWRRELPEALILRATNSVHGMGMRVPLDVAMLDSQGEVLTTRVLRPGRMTAPMRAAVDTLEAPVGSFARWGLEVGTIVTAENLVC